MRVGLRVRTRALAAVLGALPFTAPRFAFAHTTHPSTVVLDVGADSLTAELAIPLAPLGLALDEPLAAHPSTVLPRMDHALRGYVAAHFTVETLDHAPYAVSLGAFTVTHVDDADYLVTHARLVPPAHRDTHAFVLHDDVVLHRVVSHRILVSVRNDFRAGRLDARPELLGVLHFQQQSLRLDFSAGSVWRGARAVFVLGTRHIADGTDHLLFLFALLLPAPLVARSKRWLREGTARRSAGAIAKVVTAFTLGHSVTLALAASGLVRVPGAPVEVLVAVSIAVSAFHAIRPCFPGREPLVAGSFGLVHGFAFATTLATLGLDTRALAASVLAFNLGIEAMQLAIIVAVMPWLVLLARVRAYTVVRVSGALFAMLAAFGWIGERAFGLRNPVAFTFAVDALARHALAGLALLVASALAATAWRAAGCR